MRDLKRIKPFLKELGDYWIGHPDLRFGQLIYNLNMNISPDGDTFNVEDDKYLEKIKELKKDCYIDSVCNNILCDIDGKLECINKDLQRYNNNQVLNTEVGKSQKEVINEVKKAMKEYEKELRKLNEVEAQIELNMKHLDKKAKKILKEN